ncbi:hypothetical protein AVEN_218171-1 [Araneus ventricosus]|uniref:Uncharacterized protein n=1 Tax=Araneus ventricosus TaxID=182803 RepID=A0A4Y2FSJ1_ARAVE|nr:hypothetical protein AVEN_218171-1 [Araneus ventricosus]
MEFGSDGKKKNGSPASKITYIPPLTLNCYYWQTIQTKANVGGKLKDRGWEVANRSILDCKDSTIQNEVSQGWNLWEKQRERPISMETKPFASS